MTCPYRNICVEYEHHMIRCEHFYDLCHAYRTLQRARSDDKVRARKLELSMELVRRRDNRWSAN